MHHQEFIRHLQLARTEQVGPRLFQRLIQRFGNASEALLALPDIAVNARSRVKPKIPAEASILQEIEKTQHDGAYFLSITDASYPAWLKHIPDAPAVLTCKGDRTLLLNPAVALVGARNASQNSCRFAGILAGDVGKQGVVAVSGLARGIDTAVHQASLSTGTIGVIAGGIDHIYPKENAKLYAAMAEQGLIITEAAFGSTPRAEHFPRRNRIISGLSRGVVVVEAAARSGSLITARLANEQGREVMAVPGFPLDPRSEGTNQLIKNGAILIENADDILTAIQHIHTPRSGFAEESHSLEQLFAEGTASTSSAISFMPANDVTTSLETQILAALNTSPISVDALCDALSLSAASVLPILLTLELQGSVQRTAGNKVMRVGKR